MTEFLVPKPAVKILLLEDSDVDAHLLDVALRQFGFVVHRAIRLEDAIEALRTRSFDVVLSDLGLPDSNGLDTLRAVLAEGHGVPVVVLTGRSDEATALRAVASGAQDYLVKGSADTQAVVRAVRYAVERGRVTEEINRNEAQLRTLLEGAIDAVVTIRGDGRIVRWNRSAEEIFGWPRQDVLGMPMQELVVPERFRDLHRRGLAHFVATGEVPLDDRRVEWQLRRRDGSEFPVEVRISAESNGDEPTLTAFIADITARRRAEEERRASEAKFRMLVEYASDVVMMFDQSRRCTYVSPMVQSMLGYESHELIGRTMNDFVHPDDREYVDQRFESSHAQSLPVLAEFRVRHRNGSWRRLEVLRANHLADPDVRAIIADVRDVTARHETQQMLDQLRRRYELILNSICDGVLGIDLTGNVVFENPAAAKMLGHSPLELIGRPLHATIHHTHADRTPRAESECPTLWTLADGHVRKQTDDVFWQKDGTPIRVESITAPMYDDERRVAGAVMTFRDITRQRQLEQKIEQASRMASLGRVSASVAHEFNNLLMGMRPFAEVLQRRTSGDPALARPVQHVLNVVRRGQRLTDEILGFTRPPAPQLAQLDLGSWIPAFAEEARGLLGERELTMRAEETLPVRADADQLSQVMLNLAANARDATRPGDTITIGAARADQIGFLRERVAGAAGMAALFIRDSGIGIPPETLERIFEPLFTTKDNGCGLGLAIAFQIMEQHGGEILVDTELDAGTAFYLVLPLAAV